jgi:hypothetical protein
MLHCANPELTDITFYHGFGREELVPPSPWFGVDIAD